MRGEAVELAFKWRVLGDVSLDADGKPVFPPMQPGPGVYRIVIDTYQAWAYFGEAGALQERFGRYRNPGQRQPTSLRICKLICSALAMGGHSDVAVAESLSFEIGHNDAGLDLRLKAARVLVESTGIILARNEGIRSVLNLDRAFDQAYGAVEVNDLPSQTA